MRKLSISMMISLCSLNALADMPGKVMFREGESIKVTFSKTNLNRLFVKGEKITAVRFPESAFAIEKPDEKELEAGLDSLYLKPVFDGELTLFVTTNKHRNFSIQARSDDALGRTIQMVPATKRTASIKKANITAQVKVEPTKLSFNEQVIEDMSAGIKPKCLKPISFRGQSFFFKKNIKAKPLKILEGEGVKAYVYEIQNKAKQPVEISQDWFVKDKRIKALKIESKTLNANEKTRLFLVYANSIRSVG